MRILIACLVAVSVPMSAIAGEDDNTAAQVRAAVMAFNGAYENNNVDEYFSHYATDTSVYFYGARQDVAAYHEEWKAMVEAGGGVEKNAISDVRIQVMQCCCYLRRRTLSLHQCRRQQNTRQRPTPFKHVQDIS